MMYRVSHVDAFRRWEADDEADTDKLLAQIAGLGEESSAMRAGTALHKALELAPTGIETESLEANGCRFIFPLPMAIELPVIRELRASKVYMVDGRPITISGQVDTIDGRRIDDHKSTARFDPDRYLAGYAWRLYCDIFGAKQFRWNVFEIAEAACDFGDPTPVYEVKAQHRLEQFAYPGLHADCQALVERFARFVRAHVELTLVAA